MSIILAQLFKYGVYNPIPKRKVVSKRHHFFHTWIPALVLGAIGMLPNISSGQGECVVACAQSLQVSLDQSGQVTITTALVAPFAATTCPNDIELTITNAQNQIISPVLNCSLVNQTVQSKVRQISTGNFCTGNILVKDNISPTFTIADTLINCNADTSIATLGRPLVSDNCTANIIAQWISDEHIDVPCTTIYNGNYVTAKTKRTWLATDASGNTSTAIQYIWKKRNSFADITFPPNRDGLAASPLGCNANAQNLEITGRPLIGGRDVPIAGDCDLYVSFSDQNIQICNPGTRKILRTWTVTDYCVSAVNLHVQVIDVKDTIPPVLNVPPNLTFYTGLYECSGTVQLPQTTAPDACGSVSIQVNWAYGSGSGIYQNIPKGVHNVTYKATDSCGNSTSGTMTVTVADNKPPIALCQTNLLASLGSDGTIKVPAAQLNGGSYDNCSGVQLQISKNGLDFVDTLLLNCTNIGQTQTLTLRVIDSLGYTAHCTGTIQVADNIKPFITCPPNITLQCQQNINDTTLVGKAIASDNCSMQSIVFQDSSSLGNCHMGTVYRKWTAIDMAQNTSACTQKITLQPIEGFSVSPPADITLDICQGIDSTIAGRPTWNQNHCGYISMLYTDEVLSPPSADYCKRILRSWKVTDNCVYDPTQPLGQGQWTFVQQLFIKDTIAPIITVLDTVAAQASLSDCAGAPVTLFATASDCSNGVQLLHNSVYSSGSQGDASGFYPLGMHTVQFTAIDWCGNSSTSQVIIHVSACQEPTITLGGTIKTDNGAKVNQVAVIVQTPGLTSTTETTTDGSFLAEDVPTGGITTIQPVHNFNYMNGISTYDIILILKHILGIEPLTTPQKIIAADVNGSQTITSADVIAIRKLILGITDTLPVGKSWRFIPAGHNFPNPNNPFLLPFPEEISYQEPLSGDVTGIDFIALKVGDMNSNANTIQTRGAVTTTLRANIIMEDVAKDNFSVVFSLDNQTKNLEGFQLALLLDTSSYHLDSITYPMATIFRKEHNHCTMDNTGNCVITMSWNTASPTALPQQLTPAVLHLTRTSPQATFEPFALHEQILKAEAYHSEGEAIRPIEMLYNIKTTPTTDRFIAFAAPNPFAQNTNITFEMPSSTSTTLLVANPLGQIILQKELNCSKGRNNISIQRDELQDSGIYTFYLMTENYATITGRLVLVDER